MTWRRAWVYVALFAVLALFHSFSRRQTTTSEVGGPVVPYAAATPLPFLAAKPGNIVEVEIEMSGQYAQLKRSGTRWEVVRPGGAEVAGDLIGALLSAVLELPEVEVVGSTEDDTGNFGLESPSAELRLRPMGGRALIIRLGALNPAKTAIYASGSGSGQVVLLGLNIRYYLNLISKALFPQP